VVASSGVARSYVQQLKVSWGENEWGNGPVGRAIRLGQVQTMHSFRSDQMKPWRESAHKFGLHSVIALPIRIRDQIEGALAVYSEEEDAFGARELDLFSDFAASIAIGIESCRRLAERDAAQAALMKAMQMAEAASRAKSLFLANMSHELRTPLNAIIGFAEIISGEIVGPIGDKRYRQYGADIGEAARHLLQILSDVLDMSKIESGQIDLDLETVAVPAITQSALRLIKQQAERKGVAIETTMAGQGPSVTTDARALKQILINLLSNAVKFTGTGGRITIEAARDSDGGLFVDIRDTGIGIAAKDIKRVFEPFEQADHGIAKSHGGSGLGLAISRRLAHEIGAEITLESELGIGTTARLHFPARLVVR
jgi:signal transduction histidine kinase